MRVIVTRPEPDAQAWVLALRQHGIEAIALPLISVCPLADTTSLRVAWQHLGDYTALMFVSRSAVEHFFASRPPSGPTLGADAASRTRCWATGPGTSTALSRHGVDARRIDAPATDSGQFDSEALWQVVASAVYAGTRVLIVRGDDDVASVGVDAADPGRGYGRDWLAQHLLQAGAQVEFLVAYRRGVPEFGRLARDLASGAARDGSVWLFTSAQAIANLRAGLPHLDWSGARALATHARIAEAARAAGFGVVSQSRPSISDVVASIESIA